MKTMTTTNEKLLDFQTKISNSKIFVKDFNLSQLNIESIEGMNYINIKDGNNVTKLFHASIQAVSSLSKMLNIENLFSNLSGSVGKEQASKILQVIKVALSKNNKSVRLILNFETKTVENIIEKAPDYLSNDSFLKLFESKLDANSKIINYGVGQDGTQSVTFKSENWGFKLAGKTDESFNMGMLFENSPVRGTSVMPYFYRLVCTNGMVAGRGIDSMSLTLEGRKEADVLKFIQGVNALNFNSYDASEFGSRVTFMEKTRASLREIKSFKNLIIKKSNISNKDIDEKMVLNSQLEDFFPTNAIEQLYFKKGYDLESLTMKHYANIKSEITAWDLLNNLTDFASHDYGFNVSQSDMIKLQGQAGEYMLKKSFDTEFLMPQLIK
jgi:hypothetical protein